MAKLQKEVDRLEGNITKYIQCTYSASFFAWVSLFDLYIVLDFCMMHVY